MMQQASMTRLRPVIRVFVSSTFSDMKHERNALEVKVYPKLEQLCQKNGFQFQAIDLRWGVSTEAGLDHRTMRICFDELRRAQQISPRPNFLILLGNRYGWRPLPEEISVDEFNILKKAATTEHTDDTDKHKSESGDQKPEGRNPPTIHEQVLDPPAVLNAWYREDTNANPPIYLLQSRRQDLGDGQDYTDEAVWNQVQAVLWIIINRAMPPEHLQRRFDAPMPEDAPPAIVRFQASATEQEIWQGALGVQDAREHVLAYFREIENLAAFADPNQIKDFVDLDLNGSVEVALQTEQDRLKDALRQRLGSANVFPQSAPARLVEIQDQQGDQIIDVSTDHLAPLCADVENRMSELIRGQIEAYWRNTEQSSLDRTTRELEIEQDENERFAQERGGEESFVGRQVELQAILDYVGSDSRWPLVIHGASGCGKTALMARASQEVAKTRKRIERFIGVAPPSSDLRSLLSSLCQELRQRNLRADALPTEIKELRDEFAQHLQAATSEQPLILFLDALDQLADAENGRLLNWIPLGQLPPHVKLNVSCLSDRDTENPAGQPYTELKRRQIPAENFINLDVLSEAEARLLLFDRWLSKAGRKISGDQRARIEQRLASPACRWPIFLKLLFEEVQLWHSYDPPAVLGGSVSALLEQLFDRLRWPTNHGPLLVNRVLGYLSASRYGLAENEILEILFADPEYRAKINEATEQTRHELPPNAKRIPIALWSRLRFDLAPYLTERAAHGANVLTFYHHQVAEWVREHYITPSDQNWQPHQRLADYFAIQPHSSRRASELPWQLQTIREWERLKECICSPSVFVYLLGPQKQCELLGYWLALGDQYDMGSEYLDVLARLDQIPESEPLLGISLCAIASFLALAGRHDTAQLIYRRVLEIDLGHLGPEHPDIVMDLNNLAMMFRAKGDYENAASYLQQALTTQDKSRGWDHPDNATVLANLGEVLGYCKGTPAEAIPLLRRALTIKERALGPDHSETAICRNNLALALHITGDTTEAEALARRALEIDETSLGPDHPNTARDLNNLAMQFQAKGDCLTAELLYRRALTIRETSLGPFHPLTAQSLNNLGTILEQKKDLDSAISLHRRALAIRRKALGPDHPDTSISINNLAVALLAKGDRAAAESLFRSSLEIKERVLGPEHPDVALALNNLANLLRVDDDKAPAEAMCRRALRINEKALGREHPHTANLLHTLGLVLKEERKQGEAESSFRRALAIRERSFGPIHEDSIASLQELTDLLYELGNWETAEPLLRRLLTHYQSHLGKEAPQAIAVANNLALLLERQGNPADAEKMFRDITEIWQRRSDPDDPNMITSATNLAGLLEGRGGYGEAEHLLRRVLAAREHTLGQGHPDTANHLNALGNLARTNEDYQAAELYYRRALAANANSVDPNPLASATFLKNLASLLDLRGDYASAEEFSQRALEVHESLHGPEHIETAAALNDLAEILWRRGAYQLAEFRYRRALAIREKILGQENADTAVSLYGLGLVLNDMGKPTDAEPYLRRALALDQKLNKPNQVDVAASMNSLGQCLYAKGDAAGAETLFRQALSIYQEFHGTEHPATATVLSNLGATFANRGDYDQAQACCASALNIRETLLGHTHPDTGVSMLNLAQILALNGDRHAATKLCRNAEVVLRKTLGSQHPHTLFAQTQYEELADEPAEGVEL